MTKNARRRIGYHISHEQFSPRELLELVQEAEQAGFDFMFSSDHFHPWGVAQGQSGFSFSWLGAALQATAFDAGVICCPFGRHHPALVAQAVATLSQMFPERIFLALGSGQALNEHITGRAWPTKSERDVLLDESATIIRDLWEGKKVTRNSPITVDDAFLWSRPEKLPMLLGAAVTVPTAARVGKWADGLLTTGRSLPESRGIIQAFGAERGGTAVVKIGLSYARTEEQAIAQAHDQWRNATFPNHILTEIKTTEMFDELGKKVRPADLSPNLRISARVDRHVQWIMDDFAAGFTDVVLHNVGRNQREFIQDFSRGVLPQLR